MNANAIVYDIHLHFIFCRVHIYLNMARLWSIEIGIAYQIGQYLADALELAKGAIQDGCFSVTISRVKPEEISL